MAEPSTPKVCSFSSSSSLMLAANGNAEASATRLYRHQGVTNPPPPLQINLPAVGPRHGFFAPVDLSSLREQNPQLPDHARAMEILTRVDGHCHFFTMTICQGWLFRLILFGESYLGEFIRSLVRVTNPQLGQSTNYHLCHGELLASALLMVITRQDRASPGRPWATGTGTSALPPARCSDLHCRLKRGIAIGTAAAAWRNFVPVAVGAYSPQPCVVGQGGPLSARQPGVYAYVRRNADGNEL